MMTWKLSVTISPIFQVKLLAEIQPVEITERTTVKIEYDHSLSPLFKICGRKHLLFLLRLGLADTAEITNQVMLNSAQP